MSRIDDLLYARNPRGRMTAAWLTQFWKAWESLNGVGRHQLEFSDQRRLQDQAGALYNVGFTAKRAAWMASERHGMPIGRMPNPDGARRPSTQAEAKRIIEALPPVLVGAPAEELGPDYCRALSWLAKDPRVADILDRRAGRMPNPGKPSGWMNHPENYDDAGYKAGKAARQGDGATSRHWHEFAEKMLGYESSEIREQARRRYRMAYQSEASRGWSEHRYNPGESYHSVRYDAESREARALFRGMERGASSDPESDRNRMYMALGRAEAHAQAARDSRQSNPGEAWHQRQREVYGSRERDANQAADSAMASSNFQSAAARRREAIEYAAMRKAEDAAVWEYTRKRGYAKNPSIDLAQLRKIKGFQDWMLDHPDFKRGLEKYVEFHGVLPTRISQKDMPGVVPKGKAAFFVGMGKGVEETYLPVDKNSSKHGSAYIHKYADDKGKAATEKDLPDKVCSVDGKTILTVGGRFKVSDWIRG